MHYAECFQKQMNYLVTSFITSTDCVFVPESMMNLSTLSQIQVKRFRFFKAKMAWSDAQLQFSSVSCSLFSSKQCRKNVIRRIFIQEVICIQQHSVLRVIKAPDLLVFQPAALASRTFQHHTLPPDAKNNFTGSLMTPTVGKPFISPGETWRFVESDRAGSSAHCGIFSWQG